MTARVVERAGEPCAGGCGRTSSVLLELGPAQGANVWGIPLCPLCRADVGVQLLADAGPVGVQPAEYEPPDAVGDMADEYERELPEEEP